MSDPTLQQELPFTGPPADLPPITHDLAGCPTAGSLLLAQRRREAIAIRTRAENEARIERENERTRAALAERARRQAVEDAQNLIDTF